MTTITLLAAVLSTGTTAQNPAPVQENQYDAVHEVMATSGCQTTLYPVKDPGTGEVTRIYFTIRCDDGVVYWGWFEA